MGAIIGLIIMFGGVKLTWSISAFTVLLYYGVTNLCALQLPPENRLFPRWISYAGLFSCLFLTIFVDGMAILAGLAIIGLGFGVRSYFQNQQTTE